MQPPSFMAGDTAAGNRRLIESLVRGEGVASLNPSGLDLANDFKVTQDTGANMKVRVLPGGAFVKGDSAADQGMYHVPNEADVVLDVNPASGANPRIDIVVLQIHDPFYTGEPAPSWEALYIAGVPNAIPSAPDVPDSALLLAEIHVATSAAAITNADITDRRQPHSPFVGARYYRSSSTQHLDDATPENIAFPTKVWDTHGFQISNTLFQVPVGQGGLFGVKTVVTYDTDTGGGRRRAFIKRDGGTIDQAQIPPCSGGSTSVSTYTEDVFDDGQQITVEGFADAGSGGIDVVAGYGATYIEIKRLGSAPV